MSHGHPRYQIGGVEVLSFELFEAMRARGEMNAIYLARVVEGPASSESAPFFAGPAGRGEILWNAPAYDDLADACVDRRAITVQFRRLLEELSPSVVHIQHALGLGSDLVWQIRTARPELPIVYSLHEFLSICYARGHLVRTTDGSLCRDPSPTRCHGCFPSIETHRFARRRARIEATFRQVDLFLAPTRFLRDTYVEWGLPAEAIVVQPQGRRRPAPPTTSPPKPQTQRFAFLGQARPHKGLTVLLEAVARLAERGEGEILLEVHGANLEADPEHADEVALLLDRCGPAVQYRGPYRQADVASILAEVAWVVVPSIWWENSPCVIEEAFMQGRPVICTGIGGMAEKVQHEVNGLHVRRKDPDHLAATLLRAAGEPGLWERLQRGIPEVYSIEQALEDHLTLYRRLIAEGR